MERDEVKDASGGSQELQNPYSEGCHIAVIFFF